MKRKAKLINEDIYLVPKGIVGLPEEVVLSKYSKYIAKKVRHLDGEVTFKGNSFGVNVTEPWAGKKVYISLDMTSFLDGGYNKLSRRLFKQLSNFKTPQVSVTYNSRIVLETTLVDVYDFVQELQDIDKMSQPGIKVTTYYSKFQMNGHVNWSKKSLHTTEDWLAKFKSDNLGHEILGELYLDDIHIGQCQTLLLMEEYAKYRPQILQKIEEAEVITTLDEVQQEILADKGAEALTRIAKEAK